MANFVCIILAFCSHTLVQICWLEFMSSGLSWYKKSLSSNWLLECQKKFIYVSSDLTRDPMGETDKERKTKHTHTDMNKRHSEHNGETSEWVEELNVRRNAITCNLHLEKKKNTEQPYRLWEKRHTVVLWNISSLWTSSNCMFCSFSVCE